ncbi:MAG TPA: hypothetical protein VGM88_05205 [Kofleriaceae bacterium]|jgi:hypothetical protein
MKSIAILLLLAACGNDVRQNAGDDMAPPDANPNFLPNLTIPPVPANGIQIITPIVRGIAPGTDLEMCTWTDHVVTAQTDVRSTTAFQTSPGHHVIVYYTTVQQPPGTTRECTDGDMASFRFVAGSASEGQPSVAPGNLVFRIPQGAQIVINHHYLNATDETLDAQSGVNLDYADVGPTYVPDGSLAFLDTSMTIPPGDAQNIDVNCTVNHDYKVWYIAPHMHQWGKHIELDVTSSGTKTTLVDVDWSSDFVFNPPTMQFDVTAPMMMHSGDALHLRCTYDNTTGGNLLFGREMCVTYAQFIDDAGLGGLDCDGGNWGPF